MNLKCHWFMIYMTILGQFSSITGLNILVAKTGGTKSINNFFRAIIDVFLDQNHTVTFINGYKTAAHPNLTQVLVDSHFEELYGTGFGISIASVINRILYVVPKFCNEDLDHPETQKVLKDKYDLAIISFYFTECFLSVVHKQKIPYVYVTPNVITGSLSSRFGLLQYPSVFPNLVLKYSYPLNFVGRLMGTLMDSIIALLINILTIEMESSCRRLNLCEKGMPSFAELDRNASLIIVNSVASLEVPVRPMAPNIVYAGGLHIKPPRPLPKHLQDWIDNSGEEGVIYFSLGSAVKPSGMKKEHLEAFVKVFGSLKQRIIWKWDEDSIEGLPSNVLLSKWLPQQDILDHSRIRLFITHGGLFSTQEATYHGVPVLGLPVFGDQHNNIAEVVAQGWGAMLLWDQLNENTLQDAIETVLASYKLQENTKKRSKLMRDQPLSPSQLVDYWVNYIVRHDGAHHLRSPFIDIPWYQTYNVDSWVFLLFCFLCVLIIVVDLSKELLSFCCRSFMQ